MISFIRGTLAARTMTCAYVDVSGVGFEVHMPQASLSMLPDPGVEVNIHTYLHVSESGFSLYGFLSSEEESLFKNLISVSGIGPKIALAALSTFDAKDLAIAIATQNVSTVSEIPGVGKKSAQRIILELKDKLSSGVSVSKNLSDKKDLDSDALNLVRSALLSMGFTDAECEVSLSEAPEGLNESELLQYALKMLGSK